MSHKYSYWERTFEKLRKKGIDSLLMGVRSGEAEKSFSQII